MSGVCSICKKPTEKKCSKCREILYCSRECQKSDWKTHKKDCARIANLNTALGEIPKSFEARNMMCSHPEEWFRDQEVDARDRALLNAAFLPFVQYNQTSFVREMYTMKEGHDVFQDAGGKLTGFTYEDTGSGNWKSIKVCVNINVPKTETAGFACAWGKMGAKPSNIRIFKGPARSSQFHPWDAMILRDCVASTDSFIYHREIGTRKWDILAMKMCEDYDWPWVLVSMKDAGAYDPMENTSCYAL
ncbi:hypothetical protein F5Y18DRAFT_421861 [Xylariaceae sp. FL1019]|nr:hypothetical protein F5Y18DRAFT_421861 [Xylariaceae sp. FL1019]